MSEELESLAAALSSLAPHSKINRDRLMFDAGSGAALRGLEENRKSVRFWQFATGISTVASAMLGLLLAQVSVPHSPAIPSMSRLQDEAIVPNRSRSKGGTIQEELENAVDLASEPVVSGEPLYLKNRNLILAYGVEKLPARQIESPGETKASVPYRELLNSLDELTGVGG